MNVTKVKLIAKILRHYLAKVTHIFITFKEYTQRTSFSVVNHILKNHVYLQKQKICYHFFFV